MQGLAVPLETQVHTVEKPTADTRMGISMVGERGAPVVITNIDPGSLAASAGLRVGQTVMSINGMPVSKDPSKTDSEVKKFVHTFERPNTKTRIGLSLLTVTSTGQPGAAPIVNNVDPGSLAASAGLTVGQTVISVNGRTSNGGASGFYAMLRPLTGTVQIEVQLRGGIGKDLAMALMKSQAGTVHIEVTNMNLASVGMWPGLMQPAHVQQMMPAGENTVAQLRALKELLDSGVLTQEEFDAQKKIVLATSNAMPTLNPGMIQPVLAGGAQPAMMMNQHQPLWNGPPPPNGGAGSNMVWHVQGAGGLQQT